MAGILAEQAMSFRTTLSHVIDSIGSGFLSEKMLVYLVIWVIMEEYLWR
jgi:hypothetical protein